MYLPVGVDRSAPLKIARTFYNPIAFTMIGPTRPYGHSTRVAKSSL